MSRGKPYVLDACHKCFLPHGYVSPITNRLKQPPTPKGYVVFQPNLWRNSRAQMGSQEGYMYQDSQARVQGC